MRDEAKHEGGLQDDHRAVARVGLEGRVEGIRRLKPLLKGAMTHDTGGLGTRAALADSSGAGLVRQSWIVERGFPSDNARFLCYADPGFAVEGDGRDHMAAFESETYRECPDGRAS